MDWSRRWFTDLAARSAAATAVTRLVARPGVRVVAASGGWVVIGPTGATTMCGGLGELVAAVRPWGPAVPEFAAESSGRLSVAPREAREGVVLRVDPAGNGPFIVPDEESGLRVLGELAAMPWSLRYYLLGVTGVTAAWGLAGEPLTGPAPDAVVWLEWARQAGEFDAGAVTLTCRLGEGSVLDVEIRAGHVVRAREKVAA
ncbi:MAG: hypothetical protein GEU98_12255 [Pseudonocardiaceae bacterium]|nr:hypothetical protein [Pseudonocardiaceae bacterium]